MQTHTRWILAAALIATGCRSSDNDVPIAPAAPTTLPAQITPLAPAAEPEAVAPELTDADIAAIADTAHSIEIDQAKIAKAQTKNKDVRAFAQMMIDEHRAAQNEARDVLDKIQLAPEMNDMTSQMQADSVTTIARLQGLTGDDFDRFYVNSQVQAHQKVLDDLDQKLIPGADNAQLKSVLESARPMVAEHLSHAEALAKKLATPLLPAKE